MQFDRFLSVVEQTKLENHQMCPELYFDHLVKHFLLTKLTIA